MTIKLHKNSLVFKISIELFRARKCFLLYIFCKNNEKSLKTRVISNNTVIISILYYILSYLDQNGEMMKRAGRFVTRSSRYVLMTNHHGWQMKEIVQAAISVRPVLKPLIFTGMDIINE